MEVFEFVFFIYENFNAREEHKGWTVAQSANLGVLPAKTNKQKNKTKKKERKNKQTSNQTGKNRQTLDF